MVNRNTMRVTLTNPETKEQVLVKEGALTVSDYFFDVAKGNISDCRYEFKFGGNPDIGTTEEVVWDEGGNYTFLTSAEIINVVSDNANDTSAGTGARTIIIYGLDENYNEISEVITMNGLTPVPSVNSYLRLFRSIVLTSGTEHVSLDANEGTISMTSDTSTTLQAKILPRNGQTLMCVYTIPAGKTGYLAKASFSVGQGKECTFKARIRNGEGGAFSTKYEVVLYQDTISPELKVPLEIPEKTDIALTAFTNTGTVKVNSSFGILLCDN